MISGLDRSEKDNTLECFKPVEEVATALQKYCRKNARYLEHVKRHHPLTGGKVPNHNREPALPQLFYDRRLLQAESPKRRINRARLL
jgi:hypothetical protein